MDWFGSVKHATSLSRRKYVNCRVKTFLKKYCRSQQIKGKQIWRFIKSLLYRPFPPNGSGQCLSPRQYNDLIARVWCIKMQFLKSFQNVIKIHKRKKPARSISTSLCFDSTTKTLIWPPMALPRSS